MLKKSLEEILTEQESKDLISAFDQIGQIIIVRIPNSLLSKKKIIGEKLLEQVKIVRSVFYQSSDVEGEFRTRNLELLAGEDNTETEYKEYGCRFLIDVRKAFFSPRLSTERDRISGLIQKGETVLNMFAGVGMFSILAGKNNECTVYSIDINPDAARLCDENIKRNKMKGNVISINGDAATIISEKLENKSDRTLMLLPERSDEFLESAIKATKSGGIIHYYAHIHADKKNDAPRLTEEHYLKASNVKSKILNSKIVRPVGPRFYQTVVDVQIEK